MNFKCVGKKSRLMLAIGVAGALVIGCQGSRQEPAPLPSARAVPKASPFSTSFTAKNWSFHLRRLVPADGNEEVKATEIWRDLFAGIANDTKTQRLLNQLHGGLPVEFIVLDAKRGNDEKILGSPPSDGYAFVMRLADLNVDGQPGGDRVRVIAYGHVTRIEDAKTPTIAGLDKAPTELDRLPSPGEPLSLAMEDYVLRHAPGWVMVGGPYFREERIPPNIQDQQQAINKRIKEYEDHAKAYYTALRKGS